MYKSKYKIKNTFPKWQEMEEWSRKNRSVVSAVVESDVREQLVKGLSGMRNCQREESHWNFIYEICLG